MKPEPVVKNDVHLTNLEDDMWQMIVITHIFIGDIEVGQSSWVQIVSVKPEYVPS